MVNEKCWERIKYEDRLYDLHLSFGVIEARQIALNGVYGAAANRTKLGVISPGTIKEGVINNYRPTAISIKESGVNPTIHGIHDYALSTMPVVTKHDIFYAQLHNTIYPEFHMAFNHMKEIFSVFTKVKSSSIQWTLTDRAFGELAGKNITFNPKERAKYFANILSVKTSPQEPRLLFSDFKNSNLSDDGIALIRDMVVESDKWKKLYKIDINFLGDPYDRAVQQMRAFIKLTENEPYDPKLLSLKYRIFCDLPKSYQKISELINSISDTLTKDLKFEKGSYKEIKNRVMLKLNEALLLNGNDAFQAVLENYFNSKFTLDKEKRVDCEFIQLEGEFKSIHQGSQFTKAKLDNACNKLDSLVDQLSLLELCYKKIIKTSYARRNPNLDVYFSSFFIFKRNLLTFSQRKHIGLLKEKMRSLINEHVETITDKQEKEQFEWAIENYFKLARYKDWSIGLISRIDEESDVLNTRSNFTK